MQNHRRKVRADAKSPQKGELRCRFSAESHRDTFTAFIQAKKQLYMRQMMQTLIEERRIYIHFVDMGAELKKE